MENHLESYAFINNEKVNVRRRLATEVNERHIDFLMCFSTFAGHSTLETTHGPQKTPNQM